MLCLHREEVLRPSLQSIRLRRRFQLCIAYPLMRFPSHTFNLNLFTVHEAKDSPVSRCFELFACTNCLNSPVEQKCNAITDRKHTRHIMRNEHSTFTFCL